MNDTPKYKCTFCGKLYVKPQTLQKHAVMCQFIVSNKEYLKDHDIEPVISTSQLYDLVRVLINKTTAMESEIRNLKRIVKTKNKIDIYLWLSASIVPDFCFEEFTENINIVETHIDHLKMNSIVETIYYILGESVKPCGNNNRYGIPLYCSTEKSKLIYMYNRSSTWVELERVALTGLLNNIHKKIVKALYDWRIKHEAVYKEHEMGAFNDEYNELVIKVMSCDFTNTRTLAKIKNELFKIVKEEILNNEL
jgi:hypothetical protein